MVKVGGAVFASLKFLMLTWTMVLNSLRDFSSDYLPTSVTCIGEVISDARLGSCIHEPTLLDTYLLSLL
jgi:hypothetical protein